MDWKKRLYVGVMIERGGGGEDEVAILYQIQVVASCIHTILQYNRHNRHHHCRNPFSQPTDMISPQNAYISLLTHQSNSLPLRPHLNPPFLRRTVACTSICTLISTTRTSRIKNSSLPAAPSFHLRPRPLILGTGRAIPFLRRLIGGLGGAEGPGLGLGLGLGSAALSLSSPSSLLIFSRLMSALVLFSTSVAGFASTFFFAPIPTGGLISASVCISELVSQRFNRDRDCPRRSSRRFTCPSSSRFRRRGAGDVGV